MSATFLRNSFFVFKINHSLYHIHLSLAKLILGCAHLKSTKSVSLGPSEFVVFMQIDVYQFKTVLLCIFHQRQRVSYGWQHNLGEQATPTLGTNHPCSSIYIPKELSENSNPISVVHTNHLWSRLLTLMSPLDVSFKPTYSKQNTKNTFMQQLKNAHENSPWWR